jgi:hypothetical protein
VQAKGQSSQEKKSSLAETVDLKLREIGKTLEILWNNQEALLDSHKSLDDQFAVLARLTISELNSLQLSVHGADSDPCTYEYINKMFQAWAKFRSRPDFADHMRLWMMGGDLDSLPPVPTVDAVPFDGPKEQSSVEEFGGDYEAISGSESSDQSGDSCSNPGLEENPVSEGQDSDCEHCAGAEVPQVPDCLPSEPLVAAT